MSHNIDLLKVRFLRYVGIIYIIGACLNLLEIVYLGTNPIRVVIVSGVLFVVGIIHTKLFGQIKDIDKMVIIYTAITAITTLSIQLYFMKYYGSNIVWSIPMLFMMTFIMFTDKPNYLIILATGILGNIIAWIYHPSMEVQVSNLDYIARQTIYFMVIIVAAYIHRVHIKQLAVNNRRIEVQKILSTITYEMMNLSRENIAHKMVQLLNQCCKSSNTNHGWVIIDKESMALDHYSFTTTTSKDQSVFKGHAWEAIDTSIKEELTKKHFLLISKEEAKRFGYETMYTQMAAAKIQSVILFEINRNNRTIGMMAFESRHICKKEQIENEMFNVICNVVGETLNKVTLNNRLEWLSKYDSLTSTLKKRGIYEEFRNTVVANKKAGVVSGIGFLELGGLIEISETFGSAFSDEVLTMVVSVMKANVGSGDIIARSSENTFIIILQCKEGWRCLGETYKKMVEAINKPISLGNKDFIIAANLGISVYPEDGSEPDSLIKKAELAMQMGRRHGKNYINRYCSEFQLPINRKVALTNALYRALEKDEFHLVYQPQVDTKTEEIIGLEALLRWESKEHGFIPPNEFIPIAEQTGLIHDIGHWVIKRACEDNRQLHRTNTLNVKMAVNLSVEQFKKQDLVSRIEGILSETLFPSQYLEFEVTEGTATVNRNKIAAQIHQLKKLGVKMSIDDFGAEYSSFYRLSQLPINHLKIDKSFVDTIDSNDHIAYIVQEVIDYAKAFNIKTVAEGVEHKEQVEVLRAMGCDQIQGYFYYRPMKLEALIKVVTKATSN